MSSSGTNRRYARRMRLLAVTSAVAVIAAAVTFYLNRSGDAAPDSPAERTAQLSQRMQKIERAQEKQAQLLQALLDRQQGSAASAAGRPIQQMPRDTLAAVVPSPATLQATARDLDARHRKDPMDTAWSARAEAELSAVAAGEWSAETGITPRNLAIDCRSTLCRTEAEFPKQGDAQDWGELFLTMAGGTVRKSNIVVLPRPDGSAELRVYSTRKPG